MNFTHHQAQLTLPAENYKFFRVTMPQVNIEDPENIGCGHKFKMINEWTLRKTLYTNYIKQHDSQSPCFFEVKRVFGGSGGPEETKTEEIVASKEEETFVILMLAPISSQEVIIIK